MDRYVEEILDGFGEVVGGGAGGGRGPGKSRRLKVVVDAGNGAAGPTSVATFRGLGHEVVELFCEPDGTFPNHHPDPSVPENVVDLQRRVVQEGADLGLAFDGDGDRLGVIDERGRLVAADRVGAILARRVLRSNPGATILGEVKCSDVFFDDIRRHGGRAEMGQVGHSLVKDAMRRTGAVFAAELSGHMFFADRWHGFDDAIYAGARVLELISDGPDALSALLSDLPETSATPEIRVDCDDDRKFDVVEGVRSWLQTEVGGTDAEFVTIDGVRVRLPGGWGLVRASNTQPSLVLRVEGDSPERRDQILGLLERALRSQGVPMSPGAA
jgi:phosphomannomutase/phosphoglucomutase